MVLEGHKLIAAELERLWGRSVSEDCAWRYARAKNDPLPIRSARGRVWIDCEVLSQWAVRNCGILSTQKG